MIGRRVGRCDEAGLFDGGSWETEAVEGRDEDVMAQLKVLIWMARLTRSLSAQ